MVQLVLLVMLRREPSSLKIVSRSASPPRGIGIEGPPLCWCSMDDCQCSKLSRALNYFCRLNVLPLRRKCTNLFLYAIFEEHFGRPTHTVKMVRKLKHHEQKLLKKVDLFTYKGDNNHRDAAVIRRYNIQKPGDYAKYNRICGVCS